jgi:hypothetical protein
VDLRPGKPGEPQAWGQESVTIRAVLSGRLHRSNTLHSTKLGFLSWPAEFENRISPQSPTGGRIRQASQSGRLPSPAWPGGWEPSQCGQWAADG